MISVKSLHDASREEIESLQPESANLDRRLFEELATKIKTVIQLLPYQLGSLESEGDTYTFETTDYSYQITFYSESAEIEALIAPFDDRKRAKRILVKNFSSFLIFIR
ncbi:MAG: hypothetical protein QNJ68_10410 [Microcoleaceae cyanobacterium MO_207.B10]|nr:hypothetical protein [Microcoleaceae cyanobacterium MO_207.B10]